MTDYEELAVQVLFYAEDMQNYARRPWWRPWWGPKIPSAWHTRIMMSTLTAMARRARGEVDQ